MNWETWVVYDTLRHSFAFPDLRRLARDARALEDLYLRCIVPDGNPWALLALTEFLAGVDWELLLSLVREGRDDLEMPEEPGWRLRYESARRRRW